MMVFFAFITVRKRRSKINLKDWRNQPLSCRDRTLKNRSYNVIFTSLIQAVFKSPNQHRCYDKEQFNEARYIRQLSRELRTGVSILPTAPWRQDHNDDDARTAARNRQCSQ